MNHVRVSATRALVTGSSGGIGSEVCRLLAGADVATIGVDREHGRHADGLAGEYTADLADPGAAEAVFAEIVAEHGAPNLLVNNAGVFGATTFLETGTAYLDRVIAVNFTAAFRLTQAFVTARSGSGGVIVNVASVTAQMGCYDVAYAASKAAVIGMTRSLGPELAAHGIRINAVAPGQVETPMLDVVPPDTLRRRREQIPLHRPARPAEIAEAICFLAGDSATYMTSTTIDVNGGIH